MIDDMEWISVKDKLPKHQQRIKIRVEDTEAKQHELECTFNDYEDFIVWEYEDYTSWKIKPQQRIKIRVEDTEAKQHESECTFNDYEDFIVWKIKSPPNVIIYAKPTHWMPLPIPPKE
jgi:hypothetical protein